MAIRPLVLALLLVGACNGFSMAQLRRTLDIKKPKLAVQSVGVQLLDSHISEELNGTDECNDTIPIWEYMMTAGCFDDDSVFSENDTVAVNVTAFCSTCNATVIYDMVVASNQTCLNGTEFMEVMSVVVPMSAALCTQNDAGEYCAADFFVMIFEDDDDDDESEGREGPPGDSPDSTPAPDASPEDDDDFDFFEGICDEEDCPWLERFMSHQVDCVDEMFIYLFNTLCITDNDRYCVGTVGDFFGSAADRGRPPTQYDHELFCGDPCAGAVFDNNITMAQCIDEDDPPLDLGILCYQRNGTFCLPSLVDGMDDEEPEPNCTFTGDVSGWACDAECATDIDAMIQEHGCCIDAYFAVEFGEDNLPAIDTWITSVCSLTLPDAVCSDDYAHARDTAECKDLRDDEFEIVDALQCLVGYYEVF